MILDIIVTARLYKAIHDKHTTTCPKPLTAWLWDKITDKKNRSVNFESIRFTCDKDKLAPKLRFNYAGFTLNFDEFKLRAPANGNFTVKGTHIRLNFDGKAIEEYDHQTLKK